MKINWVEKSFRSLRRHLTSEKWPFRPHTCKRTRAPVHRHTHTQTHKQQTQSLSFFLSLAQTHTHSPAHTQSLYFSLSLALVPTLSLIHSTQTHTHTHIVLGYEPTKKKFSSLIIWSQNCKAWKLTILQGRCCRLKMKSGKIQLLYFYVQPSDFEVYLRSIMSLGEMFMTYDGPLFRVTYEVILLLLAAKISTPFTNRIRNFVFSSM